MGSGPTNEEGDVMHVRFSTLIAEEARTALNACDKRRAHAVTYIET